MRILDSALVAALNACERVIGLANKTLVAACTAVSFRSPNELVGKDES